MVSTALNKLVWLENILIERVSSYFQDAPEHGVRLINEGAVPRGAHSTVLKFKFETGDWEKRIVVKFYADDLEEKITPNAAARKEYDILSDLYEGLKTQTTIGVPKPLDLLENEGAVVMEAVEGENLFKLLKNSVNQIGGTSSLEKMLRYVEHCAKWLFVFQNLTTKATESAGSSDPGSDFVLELDKFHKGALMVGLGSDIANMVQSRIIELSKQVDWETLEIVGIRSDFAPWNVIVRSESVITIDFTGFRYGSRYFDPSFFSASLLAIAKNPLYSKRKIQALNERFTTAFLNFTNFEPRLYQAYLLMNLLHLLSEEKWRLKRGFIYGKTIFARILKHYEACLQELL